ncbi:Fic family protein [Wolbachia endosymbiont (group A) of Andrena hattorfiana]|uniref:Fic family protein n=1 Tax=Wolbachia endosymbiont (group A) of Andrena hattorfiana TaxID=2953977 RepID=UPI0021F8243C|nr:Fic/DOC family N-terminal domain-containing protein [Wolbachia endosymbiont (group A) of Andrena hattorfiana]
MYIKGSPSGKVVRAFAGYQAFIPNPLPPKFEWDNYLVNSLSRADHILGMLSREGAKLPNPHLLIRPFIAREAVLSSRIEGTQATLGEILAQEAGANVDRNPDDLQEVRNYISALDYGLKRLQSFPLSLQLVKEIHGKLMQGVRGSHATPGEFRRVQNWIGSPGCTIDTAKYVPPMPGELMGCLDSFEKFLHDRTLPPLIHIALCHYQFKAIHPCLDGNGRIGRLLITLLLIERKLLSSPLLYLSAFFEATRSEYYDQLYNISNRGTWHDWFSYFLNGVVLQSLDALSRAERINILIANWQTEVSFKTEGVASGIVRYLAVNPYFTIRKVVENLGVVFTTAQRAIVKLEDLGIVSQTSQGKRDWVYCATDILNILEEPTKMTENFDSTL